ncbi:organic solvent tolerance protein OstA [Synechococcales cyanobacterium C]|uniref:Organic solvent tolerance protein OstA n=1 Tax=Petrachloros mirabilis ULC683 TaxID=2781853 RepID=A0A8K2A776_9CYAN|nr:LptA/OstA family protein [Petrachloros mirabilis]NCJ06591.1 organic solvent tolerance protein OstA [Petrachloros mirabilis ULC683]
MVKIRQGWMVLGVVLVLLGGMNRWVQQTPAMAQRQNQPFTLRADVQQANLKTGVVTAQGNVQLSYPTWDMQATADQAQYFSQERRIILSGNVTVLQSGNRLQAEVITYFFDEGRFVAQPQEQQQVEAIFY